LADKSRSHRAEIEDFSEIKIDVGLVDRLQQVVDDRDDGRGEPRATERFQKLRIGNFGCQKVVVASRRQSDVGGKEVEKAQKIDVGAEQRLVARYI
jgi:hypothetical protein